jgi:cytochrome c biogenesis protein CcmG, thiol:disulfide interchange protein DsbE
MSHQWKIVIAVILILGGAVVAILKFGPEVEGATPGNRAPAYAAVDLATGDSVTVPAGYEGHVTLVNIWATWCLPCREEMPSMQELYAEYKDDGFRIAAVSIDDGDPAVVNRFVQEYGLTFDILHDRRTAIQQSYQTTGVPESFLLDREGTIVKRVIGAVDWNSPENRALIERLLEQGS